MAETKHETNIEITGSSAGAESAFKKIDALAKGKLVQSLNAVSKAIGQISRALGVFWLAWNGIQLVIAGWQKLSKLIDDVRTRTARLNFASMYNQAAHAADRLIGKQKQLNELIAEQAKRQALAREVSEITQSARRDAEDSRREVSRAEELAGVTDPRARQVILDRFAAEDEKRQAETARRERAEKVRALREEAELQRQLAAEQGAHRDAVFEEMKKQRELLAVLEASTRPDAERLAATKERIAALEKEWQAAQKANEAARDAALAAGMRADAYEEGASSAGTTAGAINRAAAWRAKEEADRRADAEFTDKLAANEMASASRRQFATLSDEEKVTELDRREAAARERMTAAQSDLADEMAKDVQDRSEERMNRARAEIESAQGEALRAAEEREALQRSIDERANAERLSRADRLAESFASGGNRLTAMGLGAGADNARTVDQINGKISTVLDVLRQELDALRGLKQGGAVATFGA